jgi:HK97 family phage prohead protease
MEKKIIIQAQGDFPFTFYIEKAIPTEENGALFVEGIASTINVDHDNERMAAEALVSMANIINETGVPLRIEHSKADNAIVGKVFKAWVDERNQLWIKAAIDPEHPAGPLMHASLKQGTKMGLSVGGRVKNAVKEMVESTGKMIKTFYDVMLDEVSVTTRPANYDAWLVAKSIATKGDDVSRFYKSNLYREFLFENPKFDYMQSFAKSVPEGSWKRTEKDYQIINKEAMNEKDKEKKEKSADDMKDEKKEKSAEDMKDEKKEKSAEDEKKEKSADDKKEDTEKSVSKGEFNALKSMVEKGFNSMFDLVKAMSTEAKQTTNPDKDKEADDTQQTAKAENGEAKDTTNPDKDKKAEVGDEAKKAQEDKGGEKKEKARDGQEDSKGNGDDEKGEREKAQKDAKDDGEADSKYEMKSVSDAIGKMQSMTKTLRGEKVTKSKEVRKSSLSEMDVFAITVAESIDALAERFEKGGKRVPGLSQALVDEIKSDPVLQKSIKEMLKMPGEKRSVSMGVPYMVDKTGKKYALTATEISDTVQKSKKENTGKSFRDVYKTNFSSFGHNEGNE